MNNYFCVLPFYSLERSQNYDTPCCLLPANADIEKIQKSMLRQERPSACQKCWDLEDRNLISDRLIKNAAFDFWSNRDIRFVEEDCQNKKHSTQILKLNTSNLCNSMCATCNEGASSSWAKIKNIPVKYNALDKELIDNIDYANLKMLSFVGGEPLYEQKNFEILKKMVELNNTNCFISIVTNGSCILTKSQVSILEKFTNLNFCLSIDGLETAFEYIRFPLKWINLLDNIKLYKSMGVHLSASYTISNLNIFSYYETISWFESQGIPFNHNLVHYPAYFSPNSLPKHVKESLPAKFLLREHQNIDDEHFKKFIKEIRHQDDLKKISIKNYLPIVANIINQNI